MNKIIIGLTGAKGSGKTTVADLMVKRGFYKLSISFKVREFAKHLFSEEEIAEAEDEIMHGVRIRGSQVTPVYWLNLSLISVSDNKDFIVIDDLTPLEAIHGRINSFQVCRPDINKEQIDEVEVIMNDENIEALSPKIDTLIGSLQK